MNRKPKFNDIYTITSSPNGPENPAGTKMLKRIKAKTLTIRNKGGIVADAIRQIARDKNLAKLANK